MYNVLLRWKRNLNNSDNNFYVIKHYSGLTGCRCNSSKQLTKVLTEGRKAQERSKQLIDTKRKKSNQKQEEVQRQEGSNKEQGQQF